MFSVLVNQMQILGGITAEIIWSRELPTWVIQVLEIMATILSVDFSALLSSPECAADLSARQRWAIGLFIPFAVILIFVLWSFFVGLWLCKNPKAREMTHHIILQSAVYVLLIGLYTTVVTKSAAIFNCKELETSITGEKQWLLEMDGKTCPIGDPDDAGLAYLGGTTLVLYGVVPFIIISATLCSVRNKAENKMKSDPFAVRMKNSPRFQILCGWAVKPFRKGAYLWETVNATVKVLMVISVVLFKDNTAKYIFQLSVLAAVVILHLWIRPYKDPVGNHVVVAFGFTEILGVIVKFFEKGTSAELAFQVSFCCVTLLRDFFVFASPKTIKGKRQD
jgi:hypothetical protein